MRKALSMILCALLISTTFAFLGPNTVVTDVSAEIVEGEGNCFEITNSTYLNVTLCSSEVVNVTLESIPEVVSFTIENVTSAQSTEITISGFEPNMTYYRHEDGYLIESFVADQNGNYSYTQDLSEPHHVFIQEEASTLYIQDDGTGGDCTSIGTWDSGTKTCLLTSDVLETIIIDADGITLDGGGHSVTRGVGSYGIYASWRSGITIRNVAVSGFSYGIYLSSSGGSTISGNTVSGNNRGIYLFSSSSNTISGNTVSGNNRGICLYHSGSNTISGNTVSGNNHRGIYLRYSGSNTLRDNVMASNTYNFDVVGSSLSHYIQDIDTSNTVDGKPIYYWVNHYYETVPSNAGYVGIVDSHDITVQDLTLTNNLQGVLFAYTSDSTIQNVVVSGNIYGILLYSSSSSTISGNTVSGNSYGIHLSSSGSNAISGNTVSGNSYGIRLSSSSSNTISGNTVSGNGNCGIYLHSSSSNTISGNTLSAGPTGIRLSYSNSNTISGNTLSAGWTGIYLSSSDSNTLTDNTVSGYSPRGIHLFYSGLNTLRSNIMTNNRFNFGVQGESLTDFTQDIDTSNTVDERPIYYWVGQSGGTVPLDAGYVGIVNSVDITVRDLTLTKNYQGLLFAYTTDSTIRNVVTSSNGWGLHLVQSSRITITENTVSGNEEGIGLYDCNDNTIDGNAISYNHGGDVILVGGIGIRLARSSGNTVSENEFLWNTGGIVLRTATDNLVSGNTILYHSSQGIGVVASSGNTIRGNTILYGESWGLRVRESDSNTIAGNTVSSTKWGIHLSSSSSNTVSGNTLSENSYGLYLENSGGNTLVMNTVSGSVFHGIWLDSSSDNTFFCNIFADNSYQLYNYESTNTWDNGTGDGNYWDDYLGVDLDGDGDGDTLLPHQGVDWHPLMDPCSANTAPEICSFITTPSVEGTAVVFTVYAGDGENDPLTYSFDFDSDGIIDESGSSSTASYTWYDDYTGTATVEVTDGEYTVEATAPVLVTNVPPDVLITGPAAGSIYPINTPVGFTGSFTDVGTEDTHTAEWRFESKLAAIVAPGTVTESGGSGTVTGSYAFADPGVYVVTLTVTDDDDGVGTASVIGDLTAMVVIYDPSAGFVTGGGWFESPPGALRSDPMVTGKAGFGFFAKYKQGADVPTGNTEFRFHAGDIKFHSTSYDWLVIAGPKAMFKGTGEINGEAGYGFLISAIDGEQPGGGGVDRIRVKIWDKTTGEIIYDNNVGNGGGVSGDGSGDDADPITMVVHGEIKIHR